MKFCKALVALASFVLLVLAPLAAAAQEAAPAVASGDAVPAWLPIVAAILTGLVYILRMLRPFLNEHVDAFKRSKIDDFVFNAVASASETTAKDIRARVADGTYTREKGKELLMDIGKNIATAVSDEFGKDYLGGLTESIVANRIENVSGHLKRVTAESEAKVAKDLRKDP